MTLKSLKSLLLWIHLGQNDKSCKAAKEKFGKEFIVGVSCSNSENLYKKAKSDGADYVAFGPAFRFKNQKKVINRFG